MKYFHQFITKKNLLFIAIFAIVGFIALQIPVAQLEGSRVKFTIYDAFAPIAGSFIGSIPGVIAVFLMQFFNFLIHGAEIVDTGTIIRFFPMLFAVLYFAKKRAANLVIPALAIVAFIAHPIGREVWYFSLFWLIPIIAHRMLFALGICGSFILVNNLLGFLEKKHLLNLGFYIDQKYLAPILRNEHNTTTTSSAT